MGRERSPAFSTFSFLLCLLFCLLFFVTLKSNFLQNIPGTVAVTHFDVGPCQIKFGGGFIGTGEEIKVILVVQSALINIQPAITASGAFIE